ncbi:MAG: EamA family transporter [Syntrophobacteraceae bacterium]
MIPARFRLNLENCGIGKIEALMHWLLLTLAAALSASTRDAAMKRFFSGLSSYQMSMYPLLFSLPLFLMTFFMIEIPPLDNTFWWSFAGALPLEFAALLMYMESIKVSPLSLSVPFLSFTPVFILLTGNILLGEAPNFIGLIGILVTVLGSYVLNLNPASRDPFHPFKAIARERGSWMMLIVAFIYSITSVLGKIAVIHSSPMFFTVSYLPALTLLFFASMWPAGKLSVKSSTRHSSKGCVVGLLIFLEAIFHSLAIPQAKVAYMIAVKRLSILFSILYGGFLFRETHMFYRVAGALLMVIGSILISVWGE